MALDDVVYAVRLLEIRSKWIEFDDQGNISWPLLDNGDTILTVDGALLLHDFTQPQVVPEASHLLGTFFFFFFLAPRPLHLLTLS